MVLLKAMRKSARRILWVVIILIVPSFIWWGTGGIKERNSNIAASVNGKKITRDVYERAYRNVYRNALESSYQNYKKNNKKEPDEAALEKLREQAKQQSERTTLDGMIRERLLLQAARRRGLEISDQELIKSIKDYQVEGRYIFQKEGKFDHQFYLDLLAYSNTTPQDFEKELVNSLLIFKLQNQVRDDIKVSEAEIKNEYIRKKERIRIKYLQFKEDDYQEGITLSEEEISDYFDQHGEDFKTEEEVRVEYLEIDIKEIEEEIKIAREEVAQYYQEHLEDYRKPEEIRARHILIKVAPGASQEVNAGAKKKITDILAQIKEGKDFAALAKEYSQGPTAVRGGELGFFARGQMVPAFEKVAFALKVGKVSDIVKTSFGYHIIKLEERKPASVSPLGEVKSTIESNLKSQKSNTLAKEKAQEIANELTGAEDWKEIAQARSLVIKEKDFFASGKPLEGESWSYEFSEAAFALKEGEISKPIKTPEAYYIIKLKEKREPRIPSLEEIKEKVEEVLIKDKAGELAKSKARECREELIKGGTLEKIAQEYSLTLKSPEPINRESYRIPREIREASFVLREGKVSQPIEAGNSYYLVKLLSREGIDEKKFAEEQETFRENYIQRKKSRMYTQWYNNLKERAKITTYLPQAE